MLIKEGFSFLELIIVIALLGIVGGITLPAILRKKDHVVTEWKKEFTLFVQRSVTRALETDKVHQLYFDFEKRLFYVQEYAMKKEEADKHKQFKPVQGKQYQLQLPEQLRIEQLYIQGKEETSHSGQMQRAWVYCMPNGYIQQIILNIIDTSSAPVKNLGIVVSQVLGKVAYYETFQQP